MRRHVFCKENDVTCYECCAEEAITQLLVELLDDELLCRRPDTVAEVEDGIIKLLMGSIWVMDSPVLALQSQEIIITFNQPAPILDSENVSKWEEILPRNGVLYQGELKVNVHRVSGVFLPLDGFYGNVVKKSADGKILKIDDGSIWHVDSLDMYDSQYWSTPYPVVMDSYKSYIINLKESKRIKMAKKKVPLH